MLNPRGPNFLLSWIMAWKNDRVKISLCHYLFFLSQFLTKKSSVISMKDFFRLDLIPRGGSSVSLEPFWRIGTGK